jgi:hypothetical protein
VVNSGEVGRPAHSRSLRLCTALLSCLARFI